MSFNCHLCGAPFDVRDGIQLLGESEEQKLARLMDGALQHMAAIHPHVVEQVNESSAAIGYLVFIQNIRSDDAAVEARTKAMLEHTVGTVEHLRQELSQEPQRELNLKAF